MGYILFKSYSHLNLFCTKQACLATMVIFECPDTETSFDCSHFGALTIKVWKISDLNLNQFWINIRLLVQIPLKEFCVIYNHSCEYIFLPYQYKLPISYSNLIQVWIDFQTKLAWGTVCLNLGALWINVWNLIQNWNLVLTPQINQCDFKPY